MLGRWEWKDASASLRWSGCSFGLNFEAESSSFVCHLDFVLKGLRSAIELQKSLFCKTESLFRWLSCVARWWSRPACSDLGTSWTPFGTGYSQSCSESPAHLGHFCRCRLACWWATHALDSSQLWRLSWEAWCNSSGSFATLLICSSELWTRTSASGPKRPCSGGSPTFQ